MKTGKKILSVFLSLLMILSALGTAAFTASAAGWGGECGIEGDNLTWAIENQETLRISGVGAMQDYDPPFWPNATVISPFSNMSNIKHIVIDEGVTTIGNNAFAADVFAEDVSLPSTLRSIGTQAFSGCPLREIDLPEGLESIGSGAFSSTSVETLRIPASVVSIGPCVIEFETCVKAIIVDEANPAYTSVAGVLFTKDMKTLCEYPCLKADERYSVPDGVERIEKNGFSNPGYLKQLYLPLSITELAPFSLHCYDYLTDLYYAGTEDQWNALIGGDPNICTADQATLHFEADGLPPVVVPEPQTVFSGSCGENVTWTLDRTAKTLTISGTGATYDYDSYIDYYYEIWESNCPFFDLRNSVSRIIIEDGVTAIGNDLFAGCRYAERVDLPASVEIIGDRAFYGCSVLQLDALPDTVRTVGASAFCGCNIPEIVLSPSLTALGEQAFRHDTVLLYTGAEAQWETLTADNADKDDLVVVCGYVPGDPVPVLPVARGMCGDAAEWTLYSDGLFEISGEGNMYNYRCREIVDEGDRAGRPPYAEYLNRAKRIAVRSGVTGVGKCAFYNSGAEEIVLEEGVKTIGNEAFCYNRQLKQLRLPASLKTVGRYLCWYAPVEDLWFAGSEKAWDALTENKSFFEYGRDSDQLPAEHFGAADEEDEEDVWSLYPDGAIPTFCSALTYYDEYTKTFYLFRDIRNDAAAYDYFNELPRIGFSGEVPADAVHVVAEYGVDFIRDAFNDLPALETVTLAGTVQSVTNAFNRCPKLRKITANAVSLDNGDGVSASFTGFSPDGALLFGYPCAETSDGEIRKYDFLENAKRVGICAVENSEPAPSFSVTGPVAPTEYKNIIGYPDITDGDFWDLAPDGWIPDYDIALTYFDQFTKTLYVFRNTQQDATVKRYFNSLPIITFDQEAPADTRRVVVCEGVNSVLNTSSDLSLLESVALAESVVKVLNSFNRCTKLTQITANAKNDGYDEEGGVGSSFTGLPAAAVLRGYSYAWYYNGELMSGDFLTYADKIGLKNEAMPDTVSNLKATATAEGVLLTWDADPTFDSYRIWKKSASAPNSESVSRIYANSYLDTEVTEGDTYTYTMGHDNQWKNDSDVAKVKIKYKVPTEPTEPEEEPGGQTNGFAQFFKKISDFFKKIVEFFKNLFRIK